MLAELFFPAEQIPSSTLSYRVQTIYWTTKYGPKSKFFLNLSPKKLTCDILMMPTAKVLKPRIVRFLYFFRRWSMIWSWFPSRFKKWGYWNTKNKSNKSQKWYRLWRRTVLTLIGLLLFFLQFLGHCWCFFFQKLGRAGKKLTF